MSVRFSCLRLHHSVAQALAVCARTNAIDAGTRREMRRVKACSGMGLTCTLLSHTCPGSRSQLLASKRLWVARLSPRSGSANERCTTTNVRLLPTVCG
eukprot:14914584-Alexandrium_andersonii.AAC.1